MKKEDSYTAGNVSGCYNQLSEYSQTKRDKASDVEVFYLRALSYYKSNDSKARLADLENRRSFWNIRTVATSIGSGEVL
jgi:hypothetical protein